jgi:D-alanyl-D-alanine carboxypeptidase
VKGAVDEPALEARLQAIADRDVATWPDMPARLLHLFAPAHGVQLEVAAGVGDRTTGAPAQPGSRFRIASVTKPFVAASALRLVERGELRLDDQISSLLPDEFLAVLADGGYDAAEITLRHLLTHTSGLYDFAASAYDATITDGFDQAIARDPSHRWTRLEQIRFAMEHGKPYGRPGEVFGYSDTNACLVGEILERATGLLMGEAIHRLVDFDRFGLTQTYLESIDPEPADPPPWSRQYERTVDVSEIDPSVDLWGGGGLVSTCSDLAAFFRSLLRGEVFEERSTLEMMTTVLEGVRRTPESGIDDDPSDAAMYMFRAQLGGRVWWGHDGWWGTTAYTCPELDVTVIAGHQQAYMPKDFDRMAVVGDALDALAGTT